MVADHQVSQHQSRIGRVQQSLSWRAKCRGGLNSPMALHRRERGLKAHPFHAPGLPWYFLESRSAPKGGIMTIGNSR